MVIDKRDMEILKFLMENSRTPLTEIAKRLGISDVAVKKRLRKLEEEGVIKKYTIIIDPSKLGFKNVSIVGIDVEPGKIFEVAEELSSRDYVKYVAITTGDHTLMIEIWAKNHNELTKILNEIEKMPGVKRICPSIIVETIKHY